MTKKLKKGLRKILLGLLVFAAAVTLDFILGDTYPNVVLGLYLAAFFVAGGDVVKKAVGNIKNGQIFDENFLMAIATVGAFLVGEYPEGAAVMLFYQVGEWFQSYAVNKSRKSIRELMDIRPDYANVKRGEEIENVDPDCVSVDDIIVIKPGERIPLDGVVTKGSTTLDTMALTGESLPQEAAVGDEVISGCVNQTGVIEVCVTKPFGESTVSKILELMENAGSRKSESENFISVFARYYTPIVVILALVLAVLPPVLMGGGWSDWIYRALSFLVVSCPCALVISIPLSFFGGLGGAGKAGILIKGSNYLEALSKTETVVFDKTGTLTKGSFAVNRIVAWKADALSEKTEDKEEVLELAAYAESGSNHPISKSLQEAYKKQIDRTRIGAVEEKSGYGVCAEIDGKKVIAGSLSYMEQQGITVAFPEGASFQETGTLVYVAKDGNCLGYIVIEDELKADAADAIAGLQKKGIRNIVMLTGDREEAAKKVADSLGIKKYFAKLLPGDKVTHIEELLSHKSSAGKLVFVGDGMNDAPVLARSDIGIAMGGLGSDAAIEAADVVIMTDEPSKIVRAIEISQKTLTIVKQNIIFAIGIKVLILAFAACGMASMWAAVFGDVGVAVIAILNAMRALRA